jgi:protein-disulfide isomerase
MQPSASRSSSKTHLNWLSALSAAGAVISFIQTRHFNEVRQGLAGFHSFCRVGHTFDCNAIDASPYAELFAGLPLSGAAMGWFVALLILSLLSRLPEFWSGLRPWMTAMAAVGSVFSVIYLAIMIAVLKVGCLLCLGVDVINFAMLGLLLWGRPKTQTLPQDQKATADLKTGAWVTGIALVLALIVSKGMQGEGPSASELKMRADEVLATQPVAVNLPAQVLSVGNPEAKVTIVKFSDFQCPSCRVGAQTLHPVLKRFGDQVRFVYRNFPLDSACNRAITRPMHPYACELARGAVCAGAQQKFEEYYQGVFERQPSLKSGSAVDVAREVGLNLPQFEACLQDPATAAQINSDIEEALTLNVQSTPTFYINGRAVSGAQPPQVWNRVIEALLK